MSETQTKAQSGFKLSPQDELNDLRMSDKALPLFNAVKAFIKDVAEPASEEWHRLGEGRPDPWQYAPGQLEVLEAAKEKAKAAKGTAAFSTLSEARQQQLVQQDQQQLR